MIHTVDLTERKQLEESLTKAKSEAESANQTKSRFIANMSHELRTPLNSILGYAQILSRDKTLNEQQMKGVEIIQTSGEHLLKVINDILEMSKIEAGRLQMNPGDFHLSKLLNNVMNIIKIRAQEKEILFDYEPSPDLPETVYGDEKRLSQILLNILDNAVKFTEKGRIVFIVSRQSSGKADQHRQAIAKIRFTIKDTGTGIPREKIRNFFAISSGA